MKYLMDLSKLPVELVVVVVEIIENDFAEKQYQFGYSKGDDIPHCLEADKEIVDRVNNFLNHNGEEMVELIEVF